MAHVAAYYRSLRPHNLEWGIMDNAINTSTSPLKLKAPSSLKCSETVVNSSSPSTNIPSNTPNIITKASTKTKKLYVEGKVSANNVKVIKATDTTMILDATVFHPQGGGQPCDIGTIKTTNNLIEFTVTMVKEDRLTGLIEHTGSYTKGNLNDLQTSSDIMILDIDIDRRNENTRNHSAGHLLDVCMTNLKFNLTPSKGYHFPDG